MRILLLSLLAFATAQVDTNSNVPRDGMEGQPPQLPMRDIAANVIRDASLTTRAVEKRDASGRCPAGQTPVPNGVPSTPNGCGPEKFEGLVPELWFNACCGQHDICYGDCPRSKAECDSAFLTCMNAACDKEFPGTWSAKRLGCRAKAGLYWGAVKIGGRSSFEGGTEDHCTCVAA